MSEHDWADEKALELLTSIMFSRQRQSLEMLAAQLRIIRSDGISEGLAIAERAMMFGDAADCDPEPS